MRDRLNCLVVFVVLLISSSLHGAEKRPNILFIIADDQSPFDLKIYNPKSELDTPVLDRLAGRGMVFDGAYHMGSMSGAVCRPSRTMVMTGRTLWNLPKDVRKPRKKTGKKGGETGTTGAARNGRSQAGSLDHARDL